MLFTLETHLLVEGGGVVVTTSLVDLDVAESDTDGPLSVVELVGDEEADDDWRGEVGLEEGLGVGWCAADGEERDVELGDEADNVEGETDP